MLIRQRDYCKHTLTMQSKTDYIFNQKEHMYSKTEYLYAVLSQPCLMIAYMFTVKTYLKVQIQEQSVEYSATILWQMEPSCYFLQLQCIHCKLQFPVGRCEEIRTKQEMETSTWEKRKKGRRGVIQNYLNSRLNTYQQSSKNYPKYPGYIPSYKLSVKNH